MAHLSRLLLVLLAAAPAHAAPVTWTLSGVVFDDGGTVAGYFVFDADTEAFSDWSLVVSGGNEGTFPAAAVDPTNSDARLIEDFGGFPVEPPIPAFRFDESVTPPMGELPRELRFEPVTALGNAHETLALNTSQSTDCYNCSPARLVTTGSLIGAPEPGGGALAALAALAWLGGRAGCGRRGLRRS